MNYNVKYRVCTTSYFTPKKNVLVYVLDDNFKFGFITYQENGTVTDSGWKKLAIINANSVVRFNIARNTENTSEIINNIDEFINAIKIVTDVDMLFKKTNETSETIDDIKSLLTWYPGDINRTIKKVNLTGNKRWIINSQLNKFNYDVEITCNRGYQFYGIYYSEESDNSTGNSGWLSYPTPLTIPANTIFSILLLNIDIDEAERNQYTGNYDIDPLKIYKSEIYNSIFIKKKTQYHQTIDYLINQENYDHSNLKYCLRWYAGAFNSSTGRPSMTSNYRWRLCSTINKFPFDVKFSTKEGHRFKIFEYTDQNYSNPTTIDWKFWPNTYTIKANTYFVICVLNYNEDQDALNMGSEYDGRYDITNIETSTLFNNIYFEFIKNIKKPNQCVESVCHQGFSNVYNSNNSILSGFINAFYQGFETCETDIKWTSDNIPVCFHDSSFTDSITGTTIVISEHTYEELITYRYRGEIISSLDEVLNVCKIYGMKLELDHLSNTFTDEQLNIMFNLVSKYQMNKFIYWATYDTSLIARILALDTNASFVGNISSNSSIQSILDTYKNSLSEKNKAIIACNYTGITVEQLTEWNKNITEPNISVGVWTIDNINIYKQYLPYTTFIVSNKYCASDAL